MTKIIKIDPDNPKHGDIMEACEALRKGEIVVFPTETVYGLGASAFNAEAARKVFEIKGRPPDNPLIVHISKLSMLHDVASDVPEIALELIRKLWPGPLTLILPKSERIPNIVTAGRPTVAVRMPSHPVAQKLIDCAGPIAAPSANISGKPSPTKAEHVIEDFFGKVSIIIDAGETLFGVESTIIDITKSKPVLLRPGPIPVEVIKTILKGEVLIPDFARGLSEAGEALAPGTKYRHYAPNVPLIVLETNDYSDLENYAVKVSEYVTNYIRLKNVRRIALICSNETKRIYENVFGNIKEVHIQLIQIGPRGNLYSIARNLFAVLRELDHRGVDVAFSEGFPEYGLGLAIMYRLRKASGFNIVKL